MIKIEKCPVCEIIKEGEECGLMVVKGSKENDLAVCCCQVILKDRIERIS